MRKWREEVMDIVESTNGERKLSKIVVGESRAKSRGKIGEKVEGVCEKDERIFFCWVGCGESFSIMLLSKTHNAHYN